MIENKDREEVIWEAQRAFLEGYAEDMDDWSALREEQERWSGEKNALAGDGATLERPEY
jgi:hypothetical protein